MNNIFERIDTLLVKRRPVNQGPIVSELIKIFEQHIDFRELSTFFNINELEAKLITMNSYELLLHYFKCIGEQKYSMYDTDYSMINVLICLGKGWRKYPGLGYYLYALMMSGFTVTRWENEEIQYDTGVRTSVLISSEVFSQGAREYANILDTAVRYGCEKRSLDETVRNILYPDSDQWENVGGRFVGAFSYYLSELGDVKEFPSILQEWVKNGALHLLYWTNSLNHRTIMEIPLDHFIGLVHYNSIPENRKFGNIDPYMYIPVDKIHTHFQLYCSKEIYDSDNKLKDRRDVNIKQLEYITHEWETFLSGVGYDQNVENRLNKIYFLMYDWTSLIPIIRKFGRKYSLCSLLLEEVENILYNIGDIIDDNDERYEYLIQFRLDLDIISEHMKREDDKYKFENIIRNTSKMLYNIETSCK